VTTAADRVALGAALLDEKDPGWWLRIDLDTLALSSSCRCVLGQLCPPEVQSAALQDPYFAYAEQLSGRTCSHQDEWAIARGFTAQGREITFADLTGEWKRLIAERRAAA
jgi:hypothetical protein